MKIFHQAGHNTSWNVQSFQDGHGDGIIFSPVHEKRERIGRLDQDVRAVSLFDPQFFVPDSPKPKFASYDFFPSTLLGEFATADYAIVAAEAAQKCIEFQLEMNFDSIVVPARFYPEMIPDYPKVQKIFSVEAFLRAAVSLRTNKRIFVTLPVTNSMISDENRQYRNKLLSWITSYPQISGVYFVNSLTESTKQIRSYDKLLSHMRVIQELSDADLDVIVGYCNTESLLLSICDPYAVTMGAYENTRAFSIDKFFGNDEDRRGPAPRIYFPRLINWMRWDTAMEIREDYPKIWTRIYEPTLFSESLISRGEAAHFTKPELYKHHFQVMASQLSHLRSIPSVERVSAVHELVVNASNLYQDIQDAGVMFADDNCSGAHLPVWSRILRNWQ